MIPILDVRDEHWIDDAKCGSQVDDWQWFDHTTRDEPTAMADARKVCGSCTVRVECLEFAIRTDAHGIWAGTTVEDRKRIVRNRARKSRAKEAS